MPRDPHVGFSRLEGRSGVVVGYGPVAMVMAPSPWDAAWGAEGSYSARLPSLHTTISMRKKPRSCLNPEGTALPHASILQTIQAQHQWAQSCPTHCNSSLRSTRYQLVERHLNSKSIFLGFGFFSCSKDRQLLDLQNLIERHKTNAQLRDLLN